MNDNRKALRAFMHLGAVDEVISARGSEASIAVSKSFKASLKPYVKEFAPPDPEVALDVAFRIAYSTLARQVMYGPVFESDRRISWKRLVDELGGACAAYLLWRTDPPSNTRPEEKRDGPAPAVPAGPRRADHSARRRSRSSSGRRSWAWRRRLAPASRCTCAPGATASITRSS